MHVTAFTAAGHAFLENDAATIRLLPMVRLPVGPQLPIGLQVPVVVSVWTEAGRDYDPHWYIVARDPDGEMRGRIERLFHWPDVPEKPFKFQVFTEYLQLIVQKPGYYTIGLYDQPEGTETEFWFPLEVYVDPSAPAPGPPPPSVT